MKLINPSFEILEQGFGIFDIFKHIELCGRTCYKSTDKITEASSEPFVDRMIDSKHYAMLEHGTVYLKKRILGFDDILLHKYLTNKYSKAFIINDVVYITTNYRVITENSWNRDLKYLCNPTEYHEKRITVKFVCNRQVSHEFVRHRVFSFAQESTRYCNYTKDKFDGQLTFIKPCWINEEYVPGEYKGSDQFIVLIEYLENVESTYNFMINSGWKPQQASTVLPNAL